MDNRQKYFLTVKLFTTFVLSTCMLVSCVCCILYLVYPCVQIYEKFIKITAVLEKREKAD